MQNRVEFIPLLAEIVKEYTKVGGTEGKDQGESQHSSHEFEFLPGPIHQPSPHPTAKVSRIWSLTPLTGVLCLGCTLAKARGSEPDRAMPNQTRVAALLPAIA